MARPQIRHLAIMSRDTEKLASFYERNFQMERLNASKDGAIFLSDGHLTLAVLPHRLEGEAAVGINHFGFQIDDVEAASAALVAEGLEQPRMRPAQRPYAEFRAADPEGNQFDLSEHGYENVEYAAHRAKRKQKVDA